MISLSFLLLVSPGFAGEDEAASDGEVVVEQQRPLESASEQRLDREAVEAFPAHSADELLQAMPGLHQSAHGGHGKAYQYYIRGFDAVHGADLAVTLEGIPLNEVSNIHGHGYLDLHFLPTLLVQGLDLTKGSSRAEVGDFGIAAAADFHLGLDETGLFGQVGGGTDRSGSAIVAWRPDQASSGNFLVAEGEAGEGVGQHRGWRQARLAGGAEGWLGETRARVFALGYAGVFESPGVLRLDDIESGKMDFYDAYPEAGDGHSSRVLAAGELQRVADSNGWRLLGWGGLRALDLRRNFTGYALDEAHGDGVRQAQQGGALGLRGRAWHDFRLLGREAAGEGGLDARLDLLQQQEQGILPDGTPWEERIDAGVGQGDVGLWGSVAWQPWRWLRLEPGLRGELLGVRLLRRIGDDGQFVALPEPAFSWAPVLCPKANVVFFPDGRANVFAAWGRGFRSPEARGIEDGDRAPVSLADTGELGVRWQVAQPLGVTLVGFHTAVSNEIIFDHAAARFLSSGATRRLGGELLAELDPLDWLRAEVEITWADGRYRDTGEALPYAPRWLASTGLYTNGGQKSVWRWNAGLRAWFLGPRPLPEGFYSQSALVVDATAHVEWHCWQWALGVDNLLGTRWRDGEFVYPSWFDRAQPESELPALHITAGDPFVLRLAVGRKFP